MFLRFCMIVVLIFAVSCASHTKSSLEIKKNAEYRRNVAAFIEEMNAKHGFDKEYLKELFDSVAPISVAKSISRDDSVNLGEANWRTYRDKMINNYRTQQGVLYYNENRQTLLRAEKRFGVAPHIIVGIIGIETNYGRIRMPYKAIDALTTLSFLSTRRGEYFKSELESFLLLTKRTDKAPSSFMGSYAGAIGIPQFMPSNIELFGVDGDGDGVVDVINSHADAIFSTANYISKHGWKKNQPVSLKVAYKGKPSMINNYVSDSACSGSKITLGTLEKVGFIIPNVNVDMDTNVRLYRVYVGDGKYEHHIAFDNLCVIMKYNKSLRYAMAVNYLGVNVANMGNIVINTIPQHNKYAAQKAGKKSIVSKKRSRPNIEKK